MDPFSILTGLAGLLEITWSVVKKLREIQEGANNIGRDLAILAGEIQALQSLDNAIRHVYAEEVQNAEGGFAGLPESDQKLWRNTVNDLRACQEAVERLHILAEHIAGKKGDKVAGWRDGIAKQLRKQTRESQLEDIRSQISMSRQSLQISLTMLDMTYTRRGAEDVQLLGFRLQREIASMCSRLPGDGKENGSDSLRSATDKVSSMPLNEHFDPPNMVSSIFTGRKAYLDGLKEAFDASVSSAQTEYLQRRFVVYGLGGSGKTQFCCKFASDNKQRFWGVFTVDASSQETAERSFVEIAKICGLDPSERAAKSWLSSSNRPWLLLIDNADDAKLDLEKCLPDGEQGLTIITTRNPAIKMHGTIGKRFYHFDRLEDAEAGRLLLRAAEHHEPPTPTVMTWTTKITTKLGGLPLALIHAGNAIKAKYCGLADYILYYERSWQMIRESRRTSDREEDDANMEEYMQVYSSYEILYSGLEAMRYRSFKDAIQLLQLFSFFHHEHIPFDVLIAAVAHPKLEREASEKHEAESEAEETTQPASWLEQLKGLVMRSLESYVVNRHPTVLPTFLLDAERSHPADNFNIRLRKALGELARLSLITYHERTDSYSMHPLVHTWVRERPNMTTGAQAVWCEAAWTTISRCILLPPLSGSVKSHADLPGKVLPHLLAVERFQERIRAEFVSNRSHLSRVWPPALKAGGLHPKRALQMAKASVVYAQCGYWVTAEHRQRAVRAFVYKMRGPGHPRAMDITLALAGTLWQQSRSNEAADLQEQVLDGCVESLGPKSPRTLKVMDALGESRRQQGRLQESLDLHEKAIDGMATLPATDPAIFHAQEHLGVTLWYCFRFDEAKGHQESAVEGMKKLLGETDLRTLLAMESLARTYRSLGAKLLNQDEKLSRHYLEKAEESLIFVIEKLTEQFGEHQPYRWLAICQLGAVKGVLGELQEGEKLLRDLIPVAIPALGDDHLGVLAGRNELARILTMQERYSEAEEILVDICRPERYCKTGTPTGDHPDRCDALWSLLDCYHKQGKIDDGLRTCDELENVIIAIRRGKKTTSTNNIFWTMIQDRRAELQDIKSTRFEDSKLNFDVVVADLYDTKATSSDVQDITASSMLRQREGFST